MGEFSDDYGGYEPPEPFEDIKSTDETWTDATGKKHRWKHMSDNHLKNVYFLLDTNYAKKPIMLLVEIRLRNLEI